MTCPRPGRRIRVGNVRSRHCYFLSRLEPRRFVDSVSEIVIVLHIQYRVGFAASDGTYDHVAFGLELRLRSRRRQGEDGSTRVGCKQLNRGWVH